MRNILQNRLFFNFVNIVILLAIFVFLLTKLKYSVIINDDMMDIISRTFLFSHGRFISELFGILLIKLIPDILGINYQDFAIVQGILKSAVFCGLIYVISIAPFRFRQKNISICCYSVLSFFTIFSSLIQMDFVWCFDTYQFFSGYVGYLFVYIIFWYKIADNYLKNKSLSKKDLIVICLLAFITAQINELLSISCTLLLILLLFDSYISKIKDKKYIIYPLVVILLTDIFVYFCQGSKELWESYQLSNYNLISYSEIINFIILFFKKIILYNAFLIVPIFCFLVFLYKIKEIKIIRYFIYSNTGFLFFILGTYFLPKTCIYTQLSDKWWFLHPGIMIGYNIFLLVSALFLLGVINAKTTNVMTKNLFTIALFLCCLIHCFINFNIDRIMCLHTYMHTKRMMYINDKLSLFYLKRGETIILPAGQPFYILPDVNPYDLAISRKFHSQTFDKNRARYLIYLEKNYNVNVDSGVTFKDNKTAMKEYLGKGGTFTRDELKKLKFSNIKMSEKISQ